MCHFDSMVSLDVEPDNQVVKCLLLFSGVILSVGSFFTIAVRYNLQIFLATTAAD